MSASKIFNQILLLLFWTAFTSSGFGASSTAFKSEEIKKIERYETCRTLQLMNFLNSKYQLFELTVEARKNDLVKLKCYSALNDIQSDIKQLESSINKKSNLLFLLKYISLSNLNFEELRFIKLIENFHLKKLSLPKEPELESSYRALYNCAFMKLYNTENRIQTFLKLQAFAPCKLATQLPNQKFKSPKILPFIREYLHSIAMSDGLIPEANKIQSYQVVIKQKDLLSIQTNLSAFVETMKFEASNETTGVIIKELLTKDPIAKSLGVGVGDLILKINGQDIYGPQSAYYVYESIASQKKCELLLRRGTNFLRFVYKLEAPATKVPPKEVKK